MNALKPFWSYYGAKYSRARHYPKPKHNLLIEPFAGSACYALHYPDINVILMDIDPVICGIWDYLIKVRPSEIMQLPDIVNSLDEIQHLPQEARALIGFWFVRGRSYPAKSFSAWGRDPQWHIHAHFWGKLAKERIASQVDRIKHWQVFNLRYSDIGELYATWFIDPPYVVGGHRYKFNTKTINYEHLTLWCQTRPGLSIVCEGKGADWLPFIELGEFSCATKKTRVTELVYVRENPAIS